ncbi:hypothetical protein EMPS_05197 [Entomortierella parvispora]|uniref:Uncharacterized protein n=1 Tax=Entomortierella parvispora TaxID=205924 RepID=A0A9P3H9W1_9FUNG|nr:hypothetical protein EMPS_05197 [Entomortierella parvispora]
MPAIRSYEGGAMPSTTNNEDPTAGMAFSVLVTVCTLLGLLFCFRRASRLLPRNLNIQLQMFKESLSGGGGLDRNGGAGARGPIALSEDDLEGAVGIDWEALDEEFLREDGEIYNDDVEERHAVEDDDDELALSSRAFEDDPEDEEDTTQPDRRTGTSN